jgi:hypothetical protein
LKTYNLHHIKLSLSDPSNDQRHLLKVCGLTGVHLEFKYQTFSILKEEFEKNKAARSARRLVDIIDTILGSIA